MPDSTTLEQWQLLPRDTRGSWLARQPDPDATLVALGDACEDLARAKVGSAIELLHELAALAPTRGCGRSRVMRGLTTALAYAGRNDEALVAADAAISSADAANLPIDSARAAVASLHPLTKLGRVDEALVRGDRAREALSALKEPKLAARADINLANIRKSIGDVDASAMHLSRARDALGDEPVMLAHVENTLGEVQWLRDDFDAARLAFETALLHFQEARQPFASAVVDSNLGDVAAREGRLQDALAHFESARRVFEADAAKSQLARVNAEEAEVLEALGAPRDALRGLDSALTWLDTNNFVAEASRARLARARVLASLGRTSEALDDAANAANVATARGDASLQRRAALLRSELALLIDDAPAAANAASAVLADANCPPRDRVTAQHHLAGALAALGDRVQARALLASAIGECRELGIGALLSDLLVARAALLDDPTARVTDLNEAVELVERLRASLGADRLRGQWTGSRLRAYEALALARLAQATPAALDAAFDAVERSKSRGLLDLVQRAADRAIATGRVNFDHAGADYRAMVEQYEQLRRRLSALYSRWDCEGPSGERRSVLMPSPSTRRALRDAEDQLEQLARRLAAERGATCLTAEPSDASVIRRSLAPDERLVQYFATADETLAFVMSRDGVAVHRNLAPSALLGELTTNALFQMRRATRLAGREPSRLLDAALAPLGRLHDLLLAPLESSIGEASTLAIVPHGGLHGLPFHALWDDASGAFAIERWTMRTAPSATLAVASAIDRAPRGEALIVGVADERAPAIADEAESLAELWPNAELLLNGDATADRVLARCSEHRVVHLACHARFAESLPHASGLRFFDRWASVREILDLSLRADCVVLAGCETGRTALQPGDDAVGLPRAFLAAGASSLLVSLWPVRDDAARAFTIDLHERLARRDRPLAALVRESMLARLMEQKHPAFWGAFGLVGADPWAKIASHRSAVGSVIRKG